MSQSGGLWALAASWLIYAAIHSVMASDRVKQAVATRCGACMRGYRLFYNVLAVGLLPVPLWLTYGLPGEPLWHWQGVLAWLANAAALAAILGFLYSLKFYDGLSFLGVRQLAGRAPPGAADEPLCISPLHRWVRHPWYSLALVVLWTRDMNAPLLVTAVMISGYFVLGSRLEERKLVATYGQAYRRYMQAVPGLLPRPWRHLDAIEAARIKAASRSPQ